MRTAPREEATLLRISSGERQPSADPPPPADPSPSGESPPPVESPPSAEPLPSPGQSQSGPGPVVGATRPDEGEEATEEASTAPVPPRRWWARRPAQVAAWAAAAVVLVAFFIRISYGGRIDADGANIALQGWDFIHGHIVMHGWLPGDATYYGFEVPILGVTELALGLGAPAAHVASALAYGIVAALAVALAVTGARGLARAARSAVVIAVLAAPLLTTLTLWTLLEEPDHPGTAVFVLLPALLIDRLPGRALIAPLLCVILCIGQVSDATVKYVVVPALVVVCAYRLLAHRRLRSFDTAVAVAALASIPLQYAVHAVLLALGGYQAVRPHNQVAAASLWPGHAATTWQVIRSLFGAVSTPYTMLGPGGSAFGLACLVAAIAGLARVIWTWRRASWAEQFLAVMIVVLIVIYAVSAKAPPDGYRVISEILPCGAVLAARALVPSRIARGSRARAAVAAVAAVLAAAAALFPLSVAATRPAAGPALGPAPGDGDSAPTAPLTDWLTAHDLTYGLSDYWSSSTVTLQSGGKVRVRAITMVPSPGTAPGYVPHAPYWETNALWYDPARHDATFVVARTGSYAPAFYEGLFGQPVAVYHVSASWTVLDYQRNLLTELRPMAGLGVGPKS